MIPSKRRGPPSLIKPSRFSRRNVTVRCSGLSAPPAQKSRAIPPQSSPSAKN
ncbi:hypothetical protein EMPG_17185 [Blastomyces silverae]|uniref:Uncharacterized protein n=1 Tax=Blastomyces silverae TaxID=2060906 RepID=A0A0H1BDS9_9EURO|nr:hypothetical protein EMPG_17185 [Blastomyces silverae]